MNKLIKSIALIVTLAVLSLALGIVLRTLLRPKDNKEANESVVESTALVETATSEDAYSSRSEGNTEDVTDTNSIQNEENTMSVNNSEMTTAESDAFENMQNPYLSEYVSTESSLYTYEQMLDDLGEMEAAFPELMSVEICGQSLDGRDIPEAVIGNRSSGKHIFIQASIHAREYINTLVAMKQIERLLVHHADGVYHGVTYDELLDKICFHILPMTNPDGVTISQFGLERIHDEALRETLEKCYVNDFNNGRTEKDRDSYWKTWKANARGVDLNRNFDAGWETYEGVSYPSSDHYKGTYPVSEPETQAIVNAVHACNAILTISYHSTGSVIYWDYGSSGEVYEKDAELAGLVSSLTGYERSSSVQSAQDAAGCSDYFVLKEYIPSVTIENGYSACPIGIEEFPSIWASNAELLPALAYNYSEIQ